MTAHGALARSEDSTLAKRTYCRTLARNEIFSCFPLPREGARRLYPNEEVLLVLSGVAGDYPDVLVVTVSRVLRIKIVGWFRGSVIKRHAPAHAVRGVEYKPSIFTKERVRVEGERDVTLIPNKKHDAERFRDEMNHVIRTGALPGLPT